MPASFLSRRELLLGTGAIATGAAASLALATPTCAAIHERLSSGFRAAGRRGVLAANNELSTVQDVICPCCGKPLFDFE